MAKHNYVLTKMCQVKGELMDPKGRGAFIKNLPSASIEKCPACLDEKGNSTGKNTVCWPCRGEGKVQRMQGGERVWIKCTSCDGTGENPNGVCQYCKGTKRSYPPYHYKEIDADGDDLENAVQDAADERTKSEADEKKAEVDAEKDVLRKFLKSMGKDYLPGWDVEKLRKEELKAKKATGG